MFVPSFHILQLLQMCLCILYKGEYTWMTCNKIYKGEQLLESLIDSYKKCLYDTVADQKESKWKSNDILSFSPKIESPEN